MVIKMNDKKKKKKKMDNMTKLLIPLAVAINMLAYNVLYSTVLGHTCIKQRDTYKHARHIAPEISAHCQKNNAPAEPSADKTINRGAQNSLPQEGKRLKIRNFQPRVCV